MRAVRTFLRIGMACLLGLIASEMIYRSPQGRETVLRLCRQAWVQAAPWLGKEPDRDWMVADNLKRAAQGEAIDEEEIGRELGRLRFQFADEAAFERALQSSGLTTAALREELVEAARARAWIEKQIAPELAVSEEEARGCYAAQAAQWQLPARFRARHLFLAAPKETVPEVIAAKQSAIQGLAVRMLAGEDLGLLIAEASEDEATKTRGGDLGFFSAARIPPEFFAEAEKLTVGQVSAPFHSRVGFHILQLTDVKPARAFGFEEVRAEILLSLGNAKRAAAVAQLRERLAL